MSKIELNNNQVQQSLDNIALKEGGLNTLLTMTLNSFMKAERQIFLDTNDNKKNKSNGYRKVKGFGVGSGLELSIPRDRLGNFKPIIMDIMKESQDTMNDLIFELYSSGLSTRQIEKISKNIYGKKLSKSSVSRITTEFYDDMKIWMNRKLDKNYPIIFIDATFISTKRVDNVSKEAYFVVLGVKADMTREILGLYNNPIESSGAWDDVLKDLKARGLKNCDLVVSDNLTGLGEVIQMNFDKINHQKCVVHLKRNILNKVKKIDKESIRIDLKYIFDIDNKDDKQKAAFKRATEIYKKWNKKYKAFDLFNDEEAFNYYTTYLKYSYEIRKMIYTTNWIERLNKDYKRVINFRNSMPSYDSVLTLLSKISIDLNEGRYKYKIHKLSNDKLFKNN